MAGAMRSADGHSAAVADTVPRERRRLWATHGVMAALLLVHVALVAYLAVTTGPTYDEPAHLAAGYRRLAEGKFDLDLGNPPLVGAVAALPLLASDVATDWRHVPDSGLVGRAFAEANGARFFAILRRARLACLPFTVLGALICWRWATRLYGRVAGLAALALWCFSPCVLAHGSLVTCDIAATACGLAAFYSLWNWLRRPSAFDAFIAGGWLGLAQLTKYVWVILYVAWPMIWLVWRSAGRGPSRPSLRKQSVHVALMLFVSLYVTNVAYLFAGTLRPINDYRLGRRLSATINSYVSAPVARAIGSVAVPLPSAYVRGIDEIQGVFEQPHRSYLHGEWSSSGWWYYYLYGLAVKMPLGVWLLIAAACALRVAQRPAAHVSDDLFPLAAVLLVIVFVTVSSSYQSHIRYVLPAQPFLFIWASGILAPGRWLLKTRRAIATACVAATACDGLMVYPHSLSYFNWAAGGPQNGGKHLVDSNLDWGQDLLALADWARERPEARPLFLAYFGGVDPRLAGLRFSPPPLGTAPELSAALAHGDVASALAPGWYAVSANFVYGMSFSVPDGRGGWIHASEGDYSYFQRYQPSERVGYSIFLYHFTGRSR